MVPVCMAFNQETTASDLSAELSHPSESVGSYGFQSSCKIKFMSSVPILPGILHVSQRGVSGFGGVWLPWLCKSKLRTV